MHLHRTFGAKFLTAKATDAFFSFYFGLFLLGDCNSVGRADLGADAAPYTKVGLQNGLGTQQASRHGAEESLDGVFAVPRKGERSSLGDTLKIGKTEWGYRTVQNEILESVGNEAASPGGGKRGDLLGREAQDLGGYHVKRVGGARCEKTADLARRSRRRTIAFHA